MSKPQVATEYIIELLKEIKQLGEDKKRLRGLLKESLVFVLYAEHWTHTVNRLSAEIQKEVGDE